MHRPEGLPGHNRRPSRRLRGRHHRRGRQRDPQHLDPGEDGGSSRRDPRRLHRRHHHRTATGPIPDAGRADARGAGHGLRRNAGPAAVHERMPDIRAHRPRGTSPSAHAGPPAGRHAAAGEGRSPEGGLHP